MLVDIVKVSIMGICGMMLGFILKETRENRVHPYLLL